MKNRITVDRLAIFLLLASLVACAAITATQQLSLPVESPLTVTTMSLPAAVEGQPYSTQLTATGGVQPYTWAETGALPAGITLSSAGILSGTIPAGTCSPAPCIYSFDVAVTDSSTAQAAVHVSGTTRAPIRSPKRN